MPWSSARGMTDILALILLSSCIMYIVIVVIIHNHLLCVMSHCRFQRCNILYYFKLIF